MNKNRKKVLVTGAGGYIGRHVIKALLEYDCEIIAVDLKFDSLEEDVEKIERSIFMDDTNIFENLGAPDICIHLAWRNGFIHNDDSHINDLPLHYNFIKNMLAGGLQNLSVMGTMHEVGYWEGAIDEYTPTSPMSLYGIAKNTLRQTTEFSANQFGANLYWLRAFYILGDDLKNNSIFSKIVQKENEGEKLFPFTTGENKYDFIMVDELAKQIAAASLQDKVIGVINCCSGKPISLAERVEKFIEDNNFKIKLKYGAFPDRPYDSPAVWGNPSKINQILKNEK